MAERNQKEKSQTPEALKRLLTVDIALTKTFCAAVEKHLPYVQYRKHYKLLEYSCHTLTWFFGSFAALWLLWNEDLFQTQVNLLFGMLIALALQFYIKFLCERKGPRRVQNNSVRFSEANSSSFPSHCSSMACFVASYFCYLQPLYSPLRLAYRSWAVVICASRILSHENYILDVMGGIFIGYAANWVLHHAWLSQDISQFLLYLPYPTRKKCSIT